MPKFLIVIMLILIKQTVSVEIDTQATLDVDDGGNMLVHTKINHITYYAYHDHNQQQQHYALNSQHLCIHHIYKHTSLSKYTHICAYTHTRTHTHVHTHVAPVL